MSRRFFLVVLLSLALALCSCAKRPTKTSEVPRLLPSASSVAVFPFSQPKHELELIFGHIPEHQGLASVRDKKDMDVDLRAKLLAGKRKDNMTFVSLPVAPGVKGILSSPLPRGLDDWAKIAKATGKDFILVPQVLDWRERDGTEAGVSSPAFVHIEMFLISSATGKVRSRAVWQEEQETLTGNLLSLGSFINRKASWVSARRLASDGMDQMLKELGLI